MQSFNPIWVPSEKACHVIQLEMSGANWIDCLYGLYIVFSIEMYFYILSNFNVQSKRKYYYSLHSAFKNQLSRWMCHVMAHAIE